MAVVVAPTEGAAASRDRARELWVIPPPFIPPVPEGRFFLQLLISLGNIAHLGLLQ